MRTLQIVISIYIEPTIYITENTHDNPDAGNAAVPT